MRCLVYLRVSTREQVEKGEGEEGFSIPAQREACARHLRDAGWQLVDEYADRGESARSADRPALQAMLARIATDRDADAVVVHKIDRLARNMEDHVAIRALLRKHGVALISVTENVEETASGRLVEGIHALMAEYVPADTLEAQIETIYQRVQLPDSWLGRLQQEMAAEAIERQHRDAAHRQLLTAQLARAEGQRRKLLDAYYANAIDVQTLKAEHARVGADITTAQNKLADLDANYTEWQQILTLAGQLATHCADAYRQADHPTRRLLNTAVFQHLAVKDGRIAEIGYRPPFDTLFSVPEFEYGTGVVQRCSYSNQSWETPYLRKELQNLLRLVAPAAH